MTLYEVDVTFTYLEFYSDRNTEVANIIATITFSGYTGTIPIYFSIDFYRGNGGPYYFTETGEWGVFAMITLPLDSLEPILQRVRDSPTIVVIIDDTLPALNSLLFH